MAASDSGTSPYRQTTASSTKNNEVVQGTLSHSVVRDPEARAHLSPAELPHSNLPFHQFMNAYRDPLNRERGSRTPNKSEDYDYFGSRQSLKRGVLTEAYPKQRGDTLPYKLYFMFNPTEISQSFGFDDSVIPSYFAEPDDLSVDLMVTGSAFGFSLLFDRTYEAYYGEPATVAGHTGPGKIGCLWDVQALGRLLGVEYKSNGQPKGPPQSRPIIASFGYEGQGLTVTGFINQVSITYATFDINMTPTRCRIDISMYQNYLSKEADSSKGSS